jgi:hypothetical protein
MMRYLKLIVAHTALIFCFVIVSLFLSYVLPWPFSHIHGLTLSLLLYLLYTESGRVVWLAFFSNFILEFFSATPFGILITAGTVSTLIVYWMYLHFFTNHSWYTAMAVTTIALLLYRILFLIMIIVSQLFSRGIEIDGWQQIYLYGVQVVVTIVATTAITGCQLVYRRFGVRSRAMSIHYESRI